MMASTNEALLDQLKASQILSTDELKRATELIGDQDDIKAAARRLVSAGLVTRWQAGQLLKGKATLVLGKYVLLERLPWGSSHAVFLAKHPTMERKVALTVLDKTSSARSEAVQSFLADARAIAALDHRHLIHVYDIDEADDRYFLVMEHVEGRHLHDAVKERGKFSVETAADVMRQIAAGLEHAHRAKLVHGGLRPTNVLLDTQGVVKIIDLGVSKLDDPTKPPPGSDGDSQVLEIASFLSPEQAAGEGATPQSDLYSLGCIGYLLLAGRPPFAQGDYAKRLASHQSEAPPDVRTLRADVPDGLAEIVLKLMAKTPSERYGDASQLVAAIERWWSAYAAQLEAAKPKVKPKPAAKPPIAKAALAAAAPSPTAKPPAAKPAPVSAKPAAKPVAAAPTAQSESGDFPGIQISAPRKSSSMPAIQSAAPMARTNGSPESAAPATNAIDAPFAVTSSTKKSPPALPGKKSAAITTSSTSESAVPVAAVAASPANRSLSPLLLAAIGGGVLLVLLLIGGGVAAYFLFGGKQSSTVAAVDESADTDDDTKAEPTDKVAAATDKGEQQGENDKPPATESNQAEEKEPKPEAKPESEPETPVAEETKDPAPPAEPPPSDPPPQEEKPKKPKPPKAKPETPEPPQAKLTDPFVGLADEVQLPPLGDEQKTPVPLGDVVVPADTACYIDLVGGEKATPTQGVGFSMEPARNGLAERDWEIKITGVPSGDTIIAQLALTETGLTFLWTPEAAKIDEAGYLANCKLNLRAADFEKYVALRQPQLASSIAVNFTRALHREELTIPFAANPETIMIELVQVEGAEKFAFEPKKLLSAKEDTAFVWFGEGDDRILGLKVDAAMQKNLQLTIIPVVNDPTTGPTKLVPKKVAAAKTQIVAASTRLNASIQAMNASPQKNQLGNQIAQAQQQLDGLMKALDAFDKLEKQFEAVQGKANLQYRVFYTDGANEVDLVRGVNAPAVEEPAAAREG